MYMWAFLQCPVNRVQFSVNPVYKSRWGWLVYRWVNKCLLFSCSDHYNYNNYYCYYHD